MKNRCDGKKDLKPEEWEKILTDLQSKLKKGKDERGQNVFGLNERVDRAAKQDR